MQVSKNASDYGSKKKNEDLNNPKTASLGLNTENSPYHSASQNDSISTNTGNTSKDNHSSSAGLGGDNSPGESKASQGDKDNKSVIKPDTECQTPPDPEGITFPNIDSTGDYFSELDEDKKAEFIDRKNDSIAVANLKKDTAKTNAEVAKQEGQSAFAIATKKKENDKHTLNLSIKTNKGKHFRSFSQELREAKSNKTNAVAKDKEAILLAKLWKNLASEDLEYQKKLKEINLAFAEAESKNKLADENYKAELCLAEAQEKIDLYEAEILRRTDISQALAESEE